MMDLFDGALLEIDVFYFEDADILLLFFSAHDQQNYHNK
jgi:hypothetical protein